MNRQFYIKDTSNGQGMPLTNIEILSPVFRADSIELLTGQGETEAFRKVVGWTDLFMGQACPLEIFWGRLGRDGEKSPIGCWVLGGNSGVRILANEDDEEWRTEGIDYHLPNGYGMQILCIEAEDIPTEVLEVIDEKPE